MRNRTVKTFLLLSAVVGLAGAAYFKDKEKKQRSPSSVPVKIWMPAPAGKHLAAVKIDIAAVTDIPLYGEQDVTLKGRILVQQESAGGVSYRWHLPTEVEVVSGSLFMDQLPAAAGQVLEPEITVRGFTQETQKKISLQAFTTRGGEKVGGSALIVSRPEETYEAKAPQLREAAEAFEKSKGKLPREF